jgi:hypothetical protein
LNNNFNPALVKFTTESALARSNHPLLFFSFVMYSNAVNPGYHFGPVTEWSSFRNLITSLLFVREILPLVRSADLATLELVFFLLLRDLAFALVIFTSLAGDSSSSPYSSSSSSSVL